MSMPDYYDVIKSRRSIRKYRKDAVSQKQIARILEAGTWAPSAHNVQPWRFVVITSSTTKEQLAKAMGTKFWQDLEADGETADTIERVVSESIERFTQAPVLLLVCLTMKEMDSYPDQKRQYAECVMGIQSVAAAVQNILLMIHVEGLSACWFCAPLFCQGEVQKTLGLAEDLLPQALITIGVPDEAPQAPKRYQLEDVVTFYEESS
jgi:coenzyme F420-0:L-glutamate ligase/coenzyme F420-1:gamma-L-glutamate ligase